MSTTILLKHSETVGKVPTSSDLEVAELALNAADGNLFLKKPNGSVVKVNDSQNVSWKKSGSLSVERKVSERMDETTTFEDFGADSSSDSTVAVQAAIDASAGRKVTGSKGPFSVTSLNNPLGVEIDDSVQVLLNGKLYNTYAHKEMVWGQETLYGWINKMVSKSAAKIVFTGDSTTAGLELPSDSVYPTIVQKSLIADGFSNISVVNRGQFGHTTQQWNNTHVAVDIAEAADLYVVRWGLNDPYAGRSLLQYATDLRAGLTKLRNAYPLSSGVGILLMTPNSTDDPDGIIPRDALWHEEVTKIHRRAARDYGCAFIDTYGIFQNSEDSGDKWMDAIKVHPVGNLNFMIASEVMDMILPTSVRLLCKRSPTTELLTLQNGWTHNIIENETDGVRGYRDSEGRVWLSGSAKEGTTTDFTIVTTLPVHLRPKNTSNFSCYLGHISVNTDGRVGILGLSHTVVTLDGINFLGA